MKRNNTRDWRFRYSTLSIDFEVESMDKSRRIVECGWKKMENWLGGLWQQLFAVKKWPPLSNKNFGGCPADLVSAWGLFVPAPSSKCFSTETFCDKRNVSVRWHLTADLLMKSKIFAPLYTLHSHSWIYCKEKHRKGNIIHFIINTFRSRLNA